MVMLANTQGIADTHPQTEDGAGPVLTLSGISKSFPGVKALNVAAKVLIFIAGAVPGGSYCPGRRKRRG